MLNLITTLFDINPDRLYQTPNSAQIEKEDLKIKADKIAECKFKIEREQDPLKKEKMISRLSYGITDFSDLL